MPLQQDDEGRKELATELYRRFHAMKTYGKEPESLDSIISVFMTDLADYPTDDVMRAMTIYCRKNQEFPTPADIVTLIDNRGRQPVSQSLYISLCKKREEQPELLMSDEWEALRRYESQFLDADSGFSDRPRQDEVLQENIRLRQQVMDLKTEIQRLGTIISEERRAFSLKLNQPVTLPDRLRSTVDWLKEKGAPQEEIDAVIAQYSEAA